MSIRVCLWRNTARRADLIQREQGTMPIFDFPLEELRNYLPERNEPKDFDSFWQNTLTEARSFPLDATFEPVDYGIRTLETFDVTYRGFGGQAVKGWLVLPRQRSGKLACVVE